MTTIHPTAVVSDAATIGENVTIGPYCVVGENVVLGDGVALLSHVSIDGRTTVGARTRLYPFSSIGQQPQDLKYEGEDSTISIGEDCVLREYVTINPGTTGGGMETRVGNDCLLMVGVHIAHDCLVGNHVVMANQASLAGHCIVDDYVRFGACAGCTSSSASARMPLSAHEFVENDVIPYGSVLGNRAYLGGLNLVGLKRRKFDRESIHNLRAAYRMIFPRRHAARADRGRRRDVQGRKARRGHHSLHPQAFERALCMPATASAPRNDLRKRLALVAGSGPCLPAIAAAREAGWQVRVLSLIQRDDLADENPFQIKVSRPDQVLKEIRAFKATHVCAVGAMHLGDRDRETLAAFAGDAERENRGDGKLSQLGGQLLKMLGIPFIGVHEIVSDLLAPEGVLGAVLPDEFLETTMRHAFSAVRRAGELDLGQALVVSARASLPPKTSRASRAHRADRGIPAKWADRRGCRAAGARQIIQARQPVHIDLPAIGPDTITTQPPPVSSVSSWKRAARC